MCKLKPFVKPNGCQFVARYNVPGKRAGPTKVSSKNRGW